MGEQRGGEVKCEGMSSRHDTALHSRTAVDKYTRPTEDWDSQHFIMEGVRAHEAPTPGIRLTADSSWGRNVTLFSGVAAEPPPAHTQECSLN